MMVVNLKTEQRKGNYSLISDYLLQEIKTTLQNKGKIILFHNRKGDLMRTVYKDCNCILECKNDIVLATTIPIIDTSHINEKKPFLTLACLVNAGTDLYLPDFASAVKTFNRIQTFKKFCKEAKINKVIIQTYTPRHYAIYCGVRSLHEEFLKKELEERKKFHYPPYCQLIKLIYQHKDRNKCEIEAQKLYQHLKLEIGNWKIIQITPSQPAFIPKVRGNYRYQIVIKSQKSKVKSQNDNSKLKTTLRSLSSEWLIDIDPVSLL